MVSDQPSPERTEQRKDEKSDSSSTQGRDGNVSGLPLQPIPSAHRRITEKSKGETFSGQI